MATKVLSSNKPEKPIRISPVVSDPNMRNPNHAGKADPEELLREMGGEDAETEQFRKSVFDTKHKTREEQTVNVDAGSQGVSTLLIFVFAVIVIALVVLIVWLVLKQNDAGKKQEEDLIRARLQQHHPRNSMPAMYPPRHYQPAPVAVPLPAQTPAPMQQPAPVPTPQQQSEDAESLVVVPPELEVADSAKAKSTMQELTAIMEKTSKITEATPDDISEYDSEMLQSYETEKKSREADQ